MALGSVLVSCAKQNQAQKDEVRVTQVEEEQINPDQIQIDDQIFAKQFLTEPSPDDFQSQGASQFTWYRGKPWPDGVLPIKFEGDASEEQRQMFWAACEEWSKVARVVCRPHTNEGNYVHVIRKTDGGCNASVGLQNLPFMKDRINLKDPDCWSSGTIVHEIGHILGLIHEHQRPDRDQYITINEDNIMDGKGKQFNRIGSAKVYGEYDFLSIMHYGRNSFPKERGLHTIEPKPGYEEFATRLGQREGLSSLDALAMSNLYGSRGEIVPLPTPAAPTPTPMPDQELKAKELVELLFLALLDRKPVYPGANGYVSNLLSRGFESGYISDIHSISESEEFGNRAKQKSPDDVVLNLYLTFLKRDIDDFARKIYVPMVREGRGGQVAREIGTSIEAIKKSVKPITNR